MNLRLRLRFIRASVRHAYHGVVNVNQLIIDYVVICDKRGEVLHFADFIPRWLSADRRAVELADAEAKAGRLAR
jgi:hypothetical protein